MGIELKIEIEFKEIIEYLFDFKTGYLISWEERAN